MDYELMMNGNVKLGQEAPDFIANSTEGKISLKDYRGKWIVFFSHPGDFTPVCTTEIIAFEKAIPYFKNLNSNLLGLSIDSNASHLAWINDIQRKTGVRISYPIIADRSGEIARKYGMLASNISNTATVRNVFIIDEKGIIRLIMVYPMNIGRNISEILRALNALQIADQNELMSPANWVPCDPMIVPMPNTFQELQQRENEINQNDNRNELVFIFQKPRKLSFKFYSKYKFESKSKSSNEFIPARKSPIVSKI